MHMLTNEDIGINLRAARRYRGFTMRKIENLTGHKIKHPMLSRYETGKSAISIEIAQQLAVLYGVPVQELLFGSRA